MSAYPYIVAAEVIIYAADADEAETRVREHLDASAFSDTVRVDVRPESGPRAGAPMIGALDDIAALLAIANGEDVSQKGAELLDLDSDALQDSAVDRLQALPLCVERTTTFEIVLGPGGPDDRLLVECGGEGQRVGEGYEIRRILYRYSWEGSGEVELVGEDRVAAEAFARRVVAELVQ